MEFWKLIFDIVILLSGALLLGALFSRFGQSPLLGYLLAGMILGGPGSVDALKLEGDIEAIAELGVSLLLFSLGLEFSWSRLKTLGAKAALCGALQVLVGTIVGSVASLAFALPVGEAIAVGAMVALSSTACVLRVLMDRAEIDSIHGRNSLAILLVQDVAVVPLALLLTVLGGTGTPVEIASGVIKTLLLATGLIAALYILLNKVAVWALGTLTFERNRELTILLAAVTGLGAAWAAHVAGLSPALGAFLAGLFLASSPFATQIRADISTLRTLLITLFFGAAGMLADPVWIIKNCWLLLGVAAAILTGKTLLVWIIIRLIGGSHATGIATGMCVAQIGEFAFVLGSIGTATGVVSAHTYMVVVSSAVMTLFATPFMVRWGPRLAVLAQRRLGPKLAEELIEPRYSSEAGPDVVIVGFGPAGQHIGRILQATGPIVCVIDLNRRMRQLAEEHGFRVHIGDATQREVLEDAHVAEAKLIAITIPDRAAALVVLDQVRRLAPLAHVVVRCRYDRHHSEFDDGGAEAVLDDEREVGAALARHVKEQMVRLIAPSPNDAGKDQL
ncbi:MAG: cation:proton antiporter [Phycisphaerales bacterium]|nr:MAG: cation:proton antiporter [Phycisphaerales bacterium]